MKKFICAVIIFFGAAVWAEETDTYLMPVPKSVTRAMVMAQKPRDAICLEEKCYYVIDKTEAQALTASERETLVPNVRRKLFAVTPNDPYFNTYQWHLNNNEWKEAAEHLPSSYVKDSYTPVIAVLDTGMRRDHPDMSIVDTDNFLGGSTGVRGFDSRGNPLTNPRDRDVGHGTHVTGIIAAPTNNGIGIASVSSGTPRILSYKVNDDDRYPEEISLGQVMAAVDDIVLEKRAGTKIVAVNMSFGGSYAKEECDAVKLLRDNGIIAVIAAGNEGSEEDGNPVMYPAACAYKEGWKENNIVSVGATDEYKKPTSYSSHGGWVEIAAPGGEYVLRGNNLAGAICSLSHTTSAQTIYSYSTNCGSTDYVYMQGTSMAAPFAAGAIGGAYAIYNKDRTASTYRDLPYSTMMEILYGTSSKNNELGGKVIKNRQLNVLNLYRAAKRCRELAKSSGDVCTAREVADNPQNILSYSPLTPETKGASGFGCSLSTGGAYRIDAALIALSAALLFIRRKRGC